MSIFNFFRNAQSGLGMTSKKSLEHRRFRLENLEERTLLDANPIGATGDDFPAVTTMIVVTDAIPTVTQVDDPSADVGGGANVITEAAPGD
ncbi:MAG: LEPR-XLL domain-containing protein, partial [Thermoguttaceae bacterium]|nr:LEPR-XLL domain-containing protein [Thermoguttaceae bacterium]